MRSRLVLALIAYVTLDFADPFMPGALNFNPDECVEAVHLGSRPDLRSTAATTPVPPAWPPHAVTPRSTAAMSSVPRVQRAETDWLVDVKRAHLAAADPPRRSEDH